MILAIDIGNSSVKAGLFEGPDLVRRSRLPSPTGEALRDFVAGQRIDRVGICSVVPELSSLMKDSAAPRSVHPPLEVSHSVRLPFAMDYETPLTLGTDRIAAAAGAWALLDGAETFITVDAGTALTMEVVQEGRFLGGAIAPGPALLARAMAIGTAQLPEVSTEPPPAAIGRSTDEGLRVGIMTTFIDGAHGLLRRAIEQTGTNPPVLVTGGWAALLEEHLSLIDRVEPDLVLHGIRALLELNPPASGLG